MKIGDICHNNPYGHFFHMFLRRDCDTDYSVILWNMIHCLDDDLYIKFSKWCTNHSIHYPNMKFYDVALAWCTTSDRLEEYGCPYSHEAIMFKKTIAMACEETRNDLNRAAEYMYDWYLNNNEMED